MGRVGGLPLLWLQSPRRPPAPLAAEPRTSPPAPQTNPHEFKQKIIAPEQFSRQKKKKVKFQPFFFLLLLFCLRWDHLGSVLLPFRIKFGNSDIQSSASRRGGHTHPHRRHQKPQKCFLQLTSPTSPPKTEKQTFLGHRYQMPTPS